MHICPNNNQIHKSRLDICWVFGVGRTVAANMSSWSVDFDIWTPLDRALDPVPTHEETIPWALVVSGRWAVSPLLSLGAAPA